MDETARKLLGFKCKLTWGIKMDIFHFNIKFTFLSFLSFSLDHHLSISFLSFIFLLNLQLSSLDYFFIWHLIFNPSDPMTDPQRVLQGDSSRQLDPLLRAPHFPQNHVGVNKGELVLPLTRLHLHRSSQAGDKVGFSNSSTLFCNFQYLLKINWLVRN